MCEATKKTCFLGQSLVFRMFANGWDGLYQQQSVLPICDHFLSPLWALRGRFWSRQQPTKKRAVRVLNWMAQT